MNGIACPKDYQIKSKIPLLILSSVAANTKIEPKIGPMQGVQPNAKAIPIKIGL